LSVALEPVRPTVIAPFHQHLLGNVPKGRVTKVVGKGGGLRGCHIKASDGLDCLSLRRISLEVFG
jgi:hypothetical protein